MFMQASCGLASKRVSGMGHTKENIYRSKVGNCEELKVSNAKFLGPGQSLDMSPCSSGRLFI